MKKVGLVGWRGMVGSVLMQRMVDEGDFAAFEPVYFSTSAVGGKAPAFGGKEGGVLHDATSIDILKTMDIVVTCQGGDYTKAVFPKLRAAGWNGHWIDAASTLRMENDAVIVLDPVNRDVIDAARHGLSTTAGGVPRAPAFAAANTVRCRDHDALLARQLQGKPAPHALARHHHPCRRQRVAQPQKGQRRLHDDGHSHREVRVREHERPERGEDVPPEHVPPGRPQRPHPLHGRPPMTMPPPMPR